MYYLIEKTVTTSGTAKAIWDKDTLDLATSQLHQTLASAMVNPDVSSCLCMVMDERGVVVRHDYWEREVTS